jgi:hypothetical protein
MMELKDWHWVFLPSFFFLLFLRKHWIFFVIEKSVISKRHDSQETVIGHKMCVFIFSANLSEVFLILRRNEWDMIKMCIGVRVKYPTFLSRFNWAWIFSTDFQKMIKYQFHESPSNGSGVVALRQTDGRTDRQTGETHMTKLMATFNFANARSNQQTILKLYYSCVRHWLSGCC